MIEDDQHRIPNDREQLSSRLAPLSLPAIPTTEEAISLYEAAGGHLTRECSFGVDPLCNNNQLINQRELLFHSSNPDFSFIYGQLVNGNPIYFEEAIISYINITRQLST